MYHWISASRLRTLPLAFSCIILGNSLAFYFSVFSLPIFILSLLTTLFLQITSNFANDFGDFINGKDTEKRKIAIRTVQEGKISPNSMKKAIILVSFLSLCCGILLLYFAFRNSSWQNFLIFLVLGLFCITAAITYTVGKNPYGYYGGGDWAVFLFFGIIGVMGSYFLQALEFKISILLPAATCGFFSVGVLNLNNLRDLEQDKLVGKNTIPVRIGKKNGEKYQLGLIFLGWFAWIMFFLLENVPLLCFSSLLTLPLFFTIGKKVYSTNTPERIDKLLKPMALGTFFTVLLFGIGIILSKLVGF